MACSTRSTQLLSEIPQNPSNSSIILVSTHNPIMKNQYVKIEKIGEGACGTVYKAKEAETNKLVAMKKFKEISSNEGIPQNCLREIQVLRTLQNRKDVAVARNAFINESGHVYVIFDYYKCNLQKLINSGEEIDWKKFILSMLEAVAGIHELNVVHRDIKPQNILMGNENQPLLADFGFAKEMQFGEVMTNMVGTPAYRAPELVLGDVKYGKAVDMWSMGCTIYEIFAKKILFETTTEVSLLAKMLNLFPSASVSAYIKSLPLFQSISNKVQKQKSEPFEVLEDVPHQYHELIRRLLDINPQTRITAKEAMLLLN